MNLTTFTGIVIFCIFGTATAWTTPKLLLKSYNINFSSIYVDPVSEVTHILANTKDEAKHYYIRVKDENLMSIVQLTDTMGGSLNQIGGIENGLYLLLLYHTKEPSVGISYIESHDGGNTWSSPKVFRNESCYPGAIKYIHETSTLYMVYNCYKEYAHWDVIYRQRTIFSTKFSDEKIIVNHGWSMDLTSIYLMENTSPVIYVYLTDRNSSSATAPLKYTYSSDEGKTWSELVKLNIETKAALTVYADTRVSNTVFVLERNIYYSVGNGSNFVMYNLHNSAFKNNAAVCGNATSKVFVTVGGMGRYSRYSGWEIGKINGTEFFAPFNSGRPLLICKKGKTSEVQVIGKIGDDFYSIREDSPSPPSSYAAYLSAPFGCLLMLLLIFAIA